MAIDFWFAIGSTYTYLTVMRLGEIARETGIAFNWRPFSVREIMVEMANQPFVEKPVKMQYMWRDIERRAAMYGFGVDVPVPYPLNEFDLANRVAMVGCDEGWCPAYTIATYARWFQEGLPAGEEPNLSGSLEDIGQDPRRVIDRAGSAPIVDAWNTATAEARSLGVFGSPTFSVGGELFWGDDRLDDALAWSRNGTLS